MSASTAPTSGGVRAGTGGPFFFELPCDIGGVGFERALEQPSASSTRRRRRASRSACGAARWRAPRPPPSAPACARPRATNDRTHTPHRRCVRAARAELIGSYHREMHARARGTSFPPGLSTRASSLHELLRVAHVLDDLEARDDVEARRLEGELLAVLHGVAGFRTFAFIARVRDVVLVRRDSRCDANFARVGS